MVGAEKAYIYTGAAVLPGVGGAASAVAIVPARFMSFYPSPNIFTVHLFLMSTANVFADSYRTLSLTLTISITLTLTCLLLLSGDGWWLVRSVRSCLL